MNCIFTVNIIDLRDVSTFEEIDSWEASFQLSEKVLG
jgi:hypothetical protein